MFIVLLSGRVKKSFISLVSFLFENVKPMLIIIIRKGKDDSGGNFFNQILYDMTKKHKGNLVLTLNDDNFNDQLYSELLVGCSMGIINVIYHCTGPRYGVPPFPRCWCA